MVGEFGALLTVVGSFLPWAIRGNETVSGISDYGSATLALGVVGAALLGAPYLKGMEGVPFRLAPMGAVLCGALAVVAVSYDMSDISRVYAHLPQLEEQHAVVAPEAGVGLRVTLAGGVLLALGALATALASPRPRV